MGFVDGTLLGIDGLIEGDMLGEYDGGVDGSSMGFVDGISVGVLGDGLGAFV